MEQDRLERLTKLAAEGIEPYPSVSGNMKAQLFTSLAEYESLEKVRLASLAESIYQGRVIQINNLGKCIFIQLKNEDKLWQIFVEKSKESAFKLAKLLQTGDFIRAFGNTFKTSKDKVCLYVDSLEFCGKALRGTGKILQDNNKVEDLELLRRQRYIDYMMNGTSILRQRHEIIRAIRENLYNNGYIEAETRTLQPVNSGANAQPFKTKYNAIGEDFFLRIAPELDLKRLIVGGLDKVFELGKNFRNEGISDKHNPEFTSLEVYTAFSDFKDALSCCLDLIHVSFGKIMKTLSFVHKTMEELLKENKIEYTYENMMEKFEKEVEPNLSKIYTDTLVIVKMFPRYSCPLARLSDEDSKFVERFEMYYNGMELANGYTELADPTEQRKRFEDQQSQKDKMDIDEDFLEALEYGMPPTSGFGIGIDRLMMILLDQKNIKDVIPFPPYKSK